MPDGLELFIGEIGGEWKDVDLLDFCSRLAFELSNVAVMVRRFRKTTSFIMTCWSLRLIFIESEILASEERGRDDEQKDGRNDPERREHQLVGHTEALRLFRAIASMFGPNWPDTLGGRGVVEWSINRRMHVRPTYQPQLHCERIATPAHKTFQPIPQSKTISGLFADFVFILQAYSNSYHICQNNRAKIKCIEVNIVMKGCFGWLISE